MAEGRAVLVESGRHVWGTDIMAVWPSARLHLRSRVFRGACLMGQWEMAECSAGVVAATNLTHSMAEHGEQTVWVRGSTWVFEDCDIRCHKGLAVCVTNGWREIAAAGNLEPLELCRAIDDQKARVIPANSSFHRCGLGGADPDRVGREGHLDPEDRQARCAVDVCDDSEVLLEQCSVHDTSVFALRVMQRAQMTVLRGHVAHALNGLLVLHHGRLRLSESRVQKVWLGAAVSVRGAGAAVVDQCDLKHCSTGLILEGAADVRMTYSAVINCTFSAFHQVSGDEGDDGMGGGDHGGCIADEPLREVTMGGNVHNRCRLTLIGNSVYSTLSRHVWWDKSRPALFVAEANYFEDDPEPVVTAAEEAEAAPTPEAAGTGEAPPAAPAPGHVSEGREGGLSHGMDGVFYCELCDMHFKNAAALYGHSGSKKHRTLTHRQGQTCGHPGRPPAKSQSGCPCIGNGCPSTAAQSRFICSLTCVGACAWISTCIA